MKVIRQYLNKPAEEQLYSEGLNLFKKYAITQYPHQWPTLKIGPFGTNKSTLIECLREIVRTAPEEIDWGHQKVEVAKVQAVVDSQPKSYLKTTAEIDIMLSLRKLRQRRAKTSQRFHQCHTDEERIKVCDAIDQINDEIKEKEAEADYIHKHGTKPQKKEEYTEPLPDDLEGLKAERNRVAGRMRQQENKIVHFLTLPENDKRRGKIQQCQEKLDKANARMLAIRLKQREIFIMKKLENGENIKH